MRALTAEDILRAWELGQGRRLIDQGLLLLALAVPEVSMTELSHLPVGQRNAQLLALRQSTLGAMAECLAVCPHCGASLEFSLDTANLATAHPVPRECQLVSGDYEVGFRLPNSLDLAAIAGCDDMSTARLMLIERCVLQAACGSEAVAAQDLPENVVLALAAAMLEIDPDAELGLELDCSDCGHTWTTVFDVASFFWTEIKAQAKRLMRDVHTLARAYGWREADILALSATRRKFYLELST